jgi:fermentation-respiration switch protein FrsA (DUF1100 family)
MSKLKILMLHGYTQSGPLFRAKTRALEKHLQKTFSPSGGCELVYITAPFVLSGADIPNWDPTTATIASSALLGSASHDEARAQVESDPDAYGWWRRRNDTFAGLEEGLECVATCLKEHGPFDGVLGFSQGGALAAMVASLLDELYDARERSFAENVQTGKGMPFPKSFAKEGGGRVHPPLKFAVSYSGFASMFDEHKAFYNPKITTPMLHIIGSLDTVVVESRSLSLVDASGGPKRVVYHPGGHFVPASQKEYVGALIAFIRDVISGEIYPKKAEEDNVEDMDLPF